MIFDLEPKKYMYEICREWKNFSNIELCLSLQVVEEDAEDMAVAGEEEETWVRSLYFFSACS